MKKSFFNIIVVSYNPGDGLFATIDSVLGQSFEDYRILVKDGMSTDGSIDRLKEKYKPATAYSDEDGKIVLLESCDNGIYHAMNIAIGYLGESYDEAGSKKAGEEPSYIYFLNCGDVFSDKEVLSKVHDAINRTNRRKGTTLPTIFYGDIFEVVTGNRVSSNPQIDDFACYRNVPSHQACFYDERLIYKNPFDLGYKVRADYEQFLRCFYREKAETCYMPVRIADYEGGGFSDKNKRISEQERKEIIRKYLPASKVRKYDFIRAITLAPLRTAISSNKYTAGFYNRLKGLVYKRRNNSGQEK